MNNNLEELLGNTIGKYGDMSLAALSVRLTYLGLTLKQTDLDSKLVNSLVKKIELQYNSEKRHESSLKDYYNRINSDNNQVIYTFDQDYFLKHYQAGIPYIEDCLIRVSDLHGLLKCKDLHWYLYALTTDDHLILLNHPLTSVALILNRNDFKINGVPAVHPMLTYKEDFRAKMVGELSIIYSSDENLPAAAIINNKSGHYRPIKEDMKFVVDLFCNKFMFSADRIKCINID